MSDLELQLGILAALFAVGPLGLHVLADPRGRTRLLRLRGTPRAERLHRLQRRALEVWLASMIAWGVVGLLAGPEPMTWEWEPPRRDWREYVGARLAFGCGLLVLVAYGVEQWAALLHLEGPADRSRVP